MAEEAKFASADFFEDLGISYEKAFGHNPGYLNFIAKSLTLLPTAPAKVLDLGCGTGKPLAQTLAAHGHRVHGIDFAEAMVSLSRAQVPASTFEQANFLEYAPKPDDDVNAVFAMYALFSLSRDEIVAMAGKWARWLRPGGMLFIASIAADEWDASGGVVWHPDGRSGDGFSAKFMGMVEFVTLFTKEGWKALLEEVGFEIVYSGSQWFSPPDWAGCENEPHYYLAARRRADGEATGSG